MSLKKRVEKIIKESGEDVLHIYEYVLSVSSNQMQKNILMYKEYILHEFPNRNKHVDSVCRNIDVVYNKRGGVPEVMDLIKIIEQSILASMNPICRFGGGVNDVIMNPKRHIVKIKNNRHDKRGLSNGFVYKGSTPHKYIGA